MITRLQELLYRVDVAHKHIIAGSNLLIVQPDTRDCIQTLNIKPDTGDCFQTLNIKPDTGDCIKTLNIKPDTGGCI